MPQQFSTGPVSDVVVDYPEYSPIHEASRSRVLCRPRLPSSVATVGRRRRVGRSRPSRHWSAALIPLEPPTPPGERSILAQRRYWVTPATRLKAANYSHAWVMANDPQLGTLYDGSKKERGKRGEESEKGGGRAREPSVCRIKALLGFGVSSWVHTLYVVDSNSTL